MAGRNGRDIGAGDIDSDFASTIAAIVTRQKSNLQSIRGGVSSSLSLMSGPGVEIVGAGLLPLPVDAGIYSTLPRRASEPPRLGPDAPQWRAGSKLPPERSIKPDCLKFQNPAWQGGRVPGTLIDAVARGAGAPTGTTVVTSLHGLLVTGPGGSLITRINQPGACNKMTP